MSNCTYLITPFCTRSYLRKHRHLRNLHSLITQARIICIYTQNYLPGQNKEKAEEPSILTNYINSIHIDL